jgi:hypothetical protein
MSKPWKKKRSMRTARTDFLRQLKLLDIEPICFQRDCGAKVESMHECITCEKLGKNYRIVCCGEHNVAGLAKLKKHALVRHPSNLLGVIAAGLKGEEI